MAKVIIVLGVIVSVGLFATLGLPMLQGQNNEPERASHCVDMRDARAREICIEDAAKHAKANGESGVAPAAEGHASSAPEN